MIYYANPCNARVLAAMMREERLGYIDTPAQGNARPNGLRWCADNGCFGKGYPGDAAFLAWLEAQGDRARCAFATAPDVVADASATLARSAPFLPRIRELGFRAALVAQDGLEDLAVPWASFDVLFIGGSTDWKVGAAARAIATEAKLRGKGLHMGRVNTRRRLRYAASIACDSVDGTQLVFAPNLNLRRLRRWLGELEQPELPL